MSTLNKFYVENSQGFFPRCCIGMAANSVILSFFIDLALDYKPNLPAVFSDTSKVFLLNQNS